MRALDWMDGGLMLLGVYVAALGPVAVRLRLRHRRNALPEAVSRAAWKRSVLGAEALAAALIWIGAVMLLQRGRFGVLPMWLQGMLVLLGPAIYFGLLGSGVYLGWAAARARRNAARAGTREASDSAAGPDGASG